MNFAPRLNAPYRSYNRIELEAQRLLCQYCREHEPITEPPIPIEEILERHLRLALSICDLRQVIGHDDVHQLLSGHFFFHICVHYLHPMRSRHVSGRHGLHELRQLSAWPDSAAGRRDFLCSGQLL